VLAVAVERRQREARDAGDRRQRLATKSEGADAGQIVEVADLGGGVAFEREARVVGGHAAAVVADLDPLAATVLEEDVDDGGAGVDRVLDELLDDRGGALDDFARRDLIHELRGKAADGGHGEKL
jgi:hypothetical protein